jgi:hypothetical protein
MECHLAVRSPEDLQLVLRLGTEGLSISEISRRSGVSRATCRAWLGGQVPARIRGARSSCAECGAPTHVWQSLPAQQYVYLLGLYLGDGTISHIHRGVFRLRITLDSRYDGIVGECQLAMGAVMPENKVGLLQHAHQNSVEVGSYSRQWPCLFPQHGPGPKQERDITLAPWQLELTKAEPEALLRGLIHSDGWRGTNRVHVRGRSYSYPRYQFSNVSQDIKDIFCSACDQLGIEWRRMNANNISIARRASVARMDEFVGLKH